MCVWARKSDRMLHTSLLALDISGFQIGIGESSGIISFFFTDLYVFHFLKKPKTNKWTKPNAYTNQGEAGSVWAVMRQNSYLKTFSLKKKWQNHHKDHFVRGGKKKIFMRAGLSSNFCVLSVYRNKRQTSHRFYVTDWETMYTSLFIRLSFGYTIRKQGQRRQNACGMPLTLWC